MTLTAFKGRCHHCGHDHGDPFASFATLTHPASVAGAREKPAVPADSEDALFDAVKDVIRHHRLTNWTREDDEGMAFPLVELLTPTGDTSIQRGVDEIDYLVDAIFMDDAVCAALAARHPTSSTEGEAHD